MTNGVVLAVESIGWAVRIVAHKTKPGRWVAKGTSEKAVHHLLMMGEAQPLPPMWRGANFWMAEVDDGIVQRALAAILDQHRTQTVEVA